MDCRRKIVEYKDKDYLLIGGAAKVLGVCIATLRSWHSKGKLVPSVVTTAGFRLYSQKSLDKFLSDSKT